MTGEYVIIGDTDQFSDCLVSTAGKTYNAAAEILNRMLHNPTDNDKKLMDGHKNFRIGFVESDKCWWNFNCD